MSISKEKEVTLECTDVGVYKREDYVAIYHCNEEYPLYLSKQDLLNMLELFEDFSLEEGQ